jgi:transcriptional regulator with XRE-family HTH domain
MCKDVPERRKQNMEIGKKLKDARMRSGFTQESVAEKVNVSRQTISNWENEKSYPDIISVIELSNLYSISLDELLKGDEKMMEHLEESTNVVKSTRKLIGAILLNIITVILLVTLSMFLPDRSYYLLVVFCLAIASSSVLLYQMIKRI